MGLARASVKVRVVEYFMGIHFPESEQEILNGMGICRLFRMGEDLTNDFWLN